MVDQILHLAQLLESLKFSRHAGLDPASRNHMLLIMFWIPAPRSGRGQA